MGAMLYFVGDDRADATAGDVLAAAARVGLGHAFERVPSVRYTGTGPGRAKNDHPGDGPVSPPDRRGGALWGQVDGDEVARLAYAPERQTWKRLVGGRDVWAGIWTDDPPGPDQLARKQMLTGYAVTLADGNEWMVPIARMLGEQDGSLVGVRAVPSRMTLDDRGTWTTGTVIERYAPLWAAACRWWDAWWPSVMETAPAPERIPYEDAVTILAANYRVGPTELDLLGAFDESGVIQILCAACDAHTAIDWLKKKLDSIADGSATGAGEKAAPPATGRRSRT